MTDRHDMVQHGLQKLQRFRAQSLIRARSENSLSTTDCSHSNSINTFNTQETEGMPTMGSWVRRLSGNNHTRHTAIADSFQVIPVAVNKANDTSGVNGERASNARRADHKTISVSKLLAESGRYRHQSAHIQQLSKETQPGSSIYPIAGQHTTNGVVDSDLSNPTVLESIISDLRIQLQQSSLEIASLKEKLSSSNNSSNESNPTIIVDSSPPKQSPSSPLDPLPQKQVSPSSDVLLELQKSKQHILDLEMKLKEMDDSKQVLVQHNLELTQQLEKHSIASEPVVDPAQVLPADPPQPDLVVLQDQIQELKTKLVKIQVDLLAAHEIIDVQHTKLETLLVQNESSQSATISPKSVQNNGRHKSIELVFDAGEHSPSDKTPPLVVSASIDQSDLLLSSALAVLENTISTLEQSSSDPAATISDISDQLDKLKSCILELGQHSKKVYSLLESTTANLQQQLQANAEIKRLVVQSSINGMSSSPQYRNKSKSSIFS
ncbi:hypothetical protein QVD99_000993 [Batrachochytrium dendrobatidis]|nr:hypothetical protein O5D80_008673 [Batrachochytrium dendrobatidis]KAK5673552.1 hypothetical protein QVD99_000993 [Batrachochytrium dendrobatidis]